MEQWRGHFLDLYSKENRVSQEALIQIPSLLTMTELDELATQIELEKASSWQRLHPCRDHQRFVDLTNAFDLVSRSSLFKILEKIGCPPKQGTVSFVG